jgi:hypothetical protein
VNDVSGLVHLPKYIYNNVGGYLMNRVAITRYFFGGFQDMIMHIPRKRVAIDKR